MFFKIGVLKNLANLTGKYLCRSLFLKTLQAKSCNIIKKKTPTQVFFCEICEMFQNTFFIEHFWWLLLSGVFFTIKSIKPISCQYSLSIPTESIKIMFSGGFKKRPVTWKRLNRIVGNTGKWKGKDWKLVY